ARCLDPEGKQLTGTVSCARRDLWCGACVCDSAPASSSFTRRSEFILLVYSGRNPYPQDERKGACNREKVLGRHRHRKGVAGKRKQCEVEGRLLGFGESFRVDSGKGIRSGIPPHNFVPISKRRC